MNVRSHPRIALAGAALAALALSGCVTDPETGNRTISKAAIGGVGGALGGYLLGDLLGGRNDRTEKIVGAGIGAIAGAGVGAYMDAQEKKMRERTAGTGVDVVRQGDELLLRMPSGITFATNQSSIQPQFQPTLNEVAATLAEYPKTMIDVLGHTDSDGTEAYNQALSERRAQSVADYLASHGVARVRVATMGYGETRPIASNETPEGKAQNRRVEIKIVPAVEG
ncbi:MULTISPECIES: OmpA family protein [Sphingobium]|uniref:Outer membrane protein OmpA-like peptidoglycan-associated protein n=1 Tax=Sphingobium lignivorans TaxID=2735886 RepID=A0ABR6NAN1_9SPHN|nr:MULTISPECIES: OmpA family protein [Sphingobium]MBB5984314.1 outer membrane protein OmpA-like peptidoglycan-associated protein [Sphingobium lignivorans]BAK64992.1 OmpA family protein [Sphingobium sp. SYK-6]